MEGSQQGLLDQKQQLEREKLELQSTITSLKESSELEDDKTISLQQDISEKDEKISSLVERTDTLQTQLEEERETHKVDRQQLEQQSRQLQERYNELEILINKRYLRHRIWKENSIRYERNMLIYKMCSKILNQTIKTYRSNYRKVQASYDENIKTHKENFDQNTEIVNTLEQEKFQLTEQLKSLHRKYEDLETESRILDEQIEEMEEELEEAQQKIESLETTLEEQKAEESGMNDPEILDGSSLFIEDDSDDDSDEDSDEDPIDRNETSQPYPTTLSGAIQEIKDIREALLFANKKRGLFEDELVDLKTQYSNIQQDIAQNLQQKSDLQEKVQILEQDIIEERSAKEELENLLQDSAKQLQESQVHHDEILIEIKNSLEEKVKRIRI